MREFFDSNANYYHWRKKIFAAHKIDISVPPMPDVGVRWSDVIDEHSLIEVPEWAKTSGFVFDDATTGDWWQPHQLQRAWLAPEPPYKRPKIAPARRSR